jgi:alkyldihydroxyacetonephosphate synthase
MRRWNGWGEESVDYPLPGGARRFVEEAIGPATRPATPVWRNVLAAVPASRLRPIQ